MLLDLSSLHCCVELDTWLQRLGARSMDFRHSKSSMMYNLKRNQSWSEGGPVGFRHRYRMYRSRCLDLGQVQDLGNQVHPCKSILHHHSSSNIGCSSLGNLDCSSLRSYQDNSQKKGASKLMRSVLMSAHLRIQRSRRSCSHIARGSKSTRSIHAPMFPGCMSCHSH